MTYPQTPGWKEPEGCSKASAISQRQKSTEMMREVMKIIRSRADVTCCEIGGLTGISILNVRPVVSQLRAQGRIVDSGNRRKSTYSNKSTTAWRVAKPEDIPSVHFTPLEKRVYYIVASYGAPISTYEISILHPELTVGSLVLRLANKGALMVHSVGPNGKDGRPSNLYVHNPNWSVPPSDD